jgi:hypothetical protein
VITERTKAVIPVHLAAGLRHAPDHGARGAAGACCDRGLCSVTRGGD